MEENSSCQLLVVRRKVELKAALYPKKEPYEITYIAFTRF